MEKTKMNLKETAQAYVPPQQTLNIAELERVSVNVELSEEQHIDKDGNPFKINVFEQDGKKYRVPSSVLKGIKSIIERIPTTTHICVLKSGNGMDTSYQVIPNNPVEQVI